MVEYYQWKYGSLAHYVEFLGLAVFHLFKSHIVIHTYRVHNAPNEVCNYIKYRLCSEKIIIHTIIIIINNLALSHVRFCYLLACKHLFCFFIDFVVLNIIM